MIIGIGVDLIELNRIESAIIKNKRFITRILTNQEQFAYHSLPSFKRQVEYLAGRFAVKEAFAKATGEGLGKLSFQDIEVLRKENGAPFVTAKGFEDKQIFVSISHSKEYAVAQIVLSNQA